jgi:hypothetical protein
MPRQKATERNGTGRGRLLHAPRFVGRDDEFATVTAALASPPAVVLIEGEAGIGKSRLVREYLARTEAVALVAACPPFRRPHTLGPVADALRQATGRVRDLGLSSLAGALRPLFPEWAADLPPAPEPAEDATAARHRLFCALAELSGRLGVTLIVAEDAHWADEATLEFLLFLAARPAANGPAGAATGSALGRPAPWSPARSPVPTARPSTAPWWPASATRRRPLSPATAACTRCSPRPPAASSSPPRLPATHHRPKPPLSPPDRSARSTSG